jgi:hypothetical protein
MMPLNRLLVPYEPAAVAVERIYGVLKLYASTLSELYLATYSAVPSSFHVSPVGDPPTSNGVPTTGAVVRFRGAVVVNAGVGATSDTRSDRVVVFAFPLVSVTVSATV